MTKKHRIKTSCPQCGCSGTTHLTDEELKKRYGDVPNIELDCHECMMVMEAEDGKRTNLMIEVVIEAVINAVENQ